jgi:peptide deformylase
MIFINPEIANQSDDKAVGTEACLSIPGKSFDVTRPLWVELRWQDLDGAAHHGRFDGVQAICICHELDHLNGLLVTETGVLQ